MNKFFLIFLMLSIGLLQVNAQSKIPTAPNATDAQGRKQGKWVITLDKNWKPTTTDIAYYRVIEYQNGKVVGKVRDFYAHNHKLQFEGEMLDDTPQNEKLKGRCVWYYDTGIKAQEMRFDDNGNLLERKYFDEKGNLIPDEQVKA
ncbi:MAG: hypothetical protein RMJ97_03865, partial [Raineya sp.]|nr:hypothetical protein [Raineya sp.]